MTLVEGRSPEQLRALIRNLVKAACDAVGAPIEAVRVVIREVPATHWAAGEETIAERRARGETGRETQESGKPDD
ncbi:4-oxalocrotonate tautomerase [Rhodococcus sp. D-1]|nr:4-oxalocrotonate tautomerase [Rhodococcus sp. D-1]